MKRVLFISICFFVQIVLQYEAKGQFYTIPDVNFKNYLLAQYPSVLNGSQQLIISNAKTLNSPISCTNLGITNLSGVEYFYKTTMINCSGNPITSLPALDSLKYLNHLWAIGCQLNQLPSLNQLTALQTLDLKSNQLTSVPSLTGLVNLQYFDCSGNQLASIPDLTGLVNLQKLFCYNNQLSQLPSLSSLSNLQVLDCPGNQLVSLPDLANNIGLTSLRCSNNQLTSLPSLSSLTNLTELSVHQNQLSTLPDLSANTMLSIVSLMNNRLTNIPDFSSYSNLTSVKLKNNQLSFSQLLPQTNHLQFATVFEFIPQDTLLDYPITMLSRDVVGQVFSGVDAGVSSNQYTWYRNGTLLSATSEAVVLSPPTPQDSGYYLCRVQNSTPVLSGLTLVVKSAKVMIGGCISSSMYDYSITSNSCMKGASIAFDEASIASAYKPFSYYLTPTSQTSSGYNFTKPVFEGIDPGKYDLRIVDQNNCELVLKQYLTVPVAEDCDNIITPNGDGIDDHYYIEKTGKAKVFTKNGLLIKEIITPAFWEGTDNSGKVVGMGYYIILINDKNKVGVIVLE